MGLCLCLFPIIFIDRLFSASCAVGCLFSLFALWAPVILESQFALYPFGCLSLFFTILERFAFVALSP